MALEISTIHKGTSAEHRFISDALRKGYIVVTPVCHTEPFDVGLVVGNRIIKIQVKAASIKPADSHWSQPCYTCRTSRHSNKGNKRYQLGDFDFLALWTEEGWFFVPFDDVGKSLNLATVRPASHPWNKKLEAWHILQET